MVVFISVVFLFLGGERRAEGRQRNKEDDVDIFLKRTTTIMARKEDFTVEERMVQLDEVVLSAVVCGAGEQYFTTTPHHTDKHHLCDLCA